MAVRIKYNDTEVIHQRVPKEIMKAIRKAAVEESRSLNNMVILALKEAAEKREKTE